MKQDDHVSTEPQRQALEAMSEELVHKLNIMIMEQERRAREFAEAHHSTLPTPAAPPIQQIQHLTPQPESPVPTPRPTPPPPAVRKDPSLIPSPQWQQPAPQPRVPRPARKPKKEKEEEGNVGMGMVIFAIIGIIMLIRSCS
jgi:hypothetical protein